MGWSHEHVPLRAPLREATVHFRLLGVGVGSRLRVLNRVQVRDTARFIG